MDKEILKNISKQDKPTKVDIPVVRHISGEKLKVVVRKDLIIENVRAFRKAETQEEKDELLAEIIEDDKILEKMENEK